MANDKKSTGKDMSMSKTTYPKEENTLKKAQDDETLTKTGRKKWKKPKDKPNRPLSAYNIYFKEQREIMMRELTNKQQQQKSTSSTITSTTKKGSSRRIKSGVGFGGLAKKIATKWKELDTATKEPYESKAKVLKGQYFLALDEWKRKKKREEFLRENPDIAREISTIPSPSVKQQMKDEITTITSTTRAVSPHANTIIRNNEYIPFPDGHLSSNDALLSPAKECQQLPLPLITTKTSALINAKERQGTDFDSFVGISDDCDMGLTHNRRATHNIPQHFYIDKNEVKESSSSLSPKSTLDLEPYSISQYMTIRPQDILLDENSQLRQKYSNLPSLDVSKIQKHVNGILDAADVLDAAITASDDCIDNWASLEGIEL